MMPNDSLRAVKFLEQGQNQKAEVLLRTIVRRNPLDHLVLSNLAVALKRQGKNSESLHFIQESLKIKRTSVNLSNACNIMRICGLFGESILLGEESLALQDSANCRANLAMSYLAIGQPDQAKLNAQLALKADPNQVSACITLFRIDLKYSGPISAEKYLQKALEISPADDDVQRAYAEHLIMNGSAQEAMQLYEKLHRQSHSADYVGLQYARALCSLGIDQQALPILLELVKIGCNEPSVHGLLQQLVSYLDDEWQWLADDLLSEELLQSSEKSQISLMQLYQARATYYHRLQKFSTASIYWARKLDVQSKLAEPSHDVDRLRSRIQDELAAYDSSLRHHEQAVRNLSGIGFGSEFIFIVGMPRCGSTLLETILANNPQCADLGESLALGRVLRQADQQGTLSIEAVAELGHRYAELVRAQVGESCSYNYFTDKLLSNFLHIPVIRMILPGAKIVVCTRNPMDHVLSLIKEDFASLNAYAGDVRCAAEAIACYYSAIEALRQRGCLQGAIDYHYDSVVSNPTQELPRLIGQLGWTWDPVYLSPESSQRAIVTASINQARRPISAASLGGWKHYRDLLEPAREIFDSRAIGYQIH
jgi:Tfp pilus assembly protein PilF